MGGATKTCGEGKELGGLHQQGSVLNEVGAASGESADYFWDRLEEAALSVEDRLSSIESSLVSCSARISDLLDSIDARARH
jgi:hypothetical protein